jgi:hypothetical protein
VCEPWFTIMILILSSTGKSAVNGPSVARADSERRGIS